MSAPPSRLTLWLDRNRNVPTRVVERYLATARASHAEWECTVKELTRRLATAVNRVDKEAGHIEEYTAVLKARREMGQE